MESRSFTEGVEGLEDAVITKACSLAMRAHNSVAPAFLVDRAASPTHTIFAFPGLSSVNEWFSRSSFGDSNIDVTLFPSLRSVGSAETAIVNESFLRRFKTVLEASNLQDEVRKAFEENKRLLLTGHSSGGPIAILTTIWILEQQKQHKHFQYTPSCVTFGCPLVGDQIFGHALRRENWSRHFIHFVTRYDIVPRISLAPLPDIENLLPAVHCFFNPNSADFIQEATVRSQASLFFHTVMRSAASLTTHAASLLMGSTNLLLKSISSFVELSPYRPFGTYIFCNASGKMVVVKNPDAILQMFFHCLQLSPEEDIADVACRSLQEHLLYQHVSQSLRTQQVIHLDNLQSIPLSANGADDDKKLLDMALNDFGLNTRARICLRAAGELEKRTMQNHHKIDYNFGKIEEALDMVNGYRAKCELLETNYYDAFKYQRKTDDFNANVKRLELAGMWDEIIEMLKRYELPDDFEARKKWVELGTKYRRLVEPLDISNYYRHSKNDDTGPYMVKGRPRRYRYTQRWLEHARIVAPNSCTESCFWAELEELYQDGGSKITFEEAKERVLKLEKNIESWVASGEISKDVFLEESTFVKWWKTLPHQYTAGSRITLLIDEQRRSLPLLN